MQALGDGADWWLALHVIQLPLFGLLGLAVYLLTDGIADPLVRLSRAALIGLGVVVFGVWHAPPVGPVGMLLFLAGSALLELRSPHPAARRTFATA